MYLYIMVIIESQKMLKFIAIIKLSNIPYGVDY